MKIIHTQDYSGHTFIVEMDDKSSFEKCDIQIYGSAKTKQEAVAKALSAVASAKGLLNDCEKELKDA